MEAQYALECIKPFLDMSLRSGGYSHGFLSDLAAAIGQENYNPHAIIDEISILEGGGRAPSQTKPASMFTRKHLKGLWHKHHTQPRFMVHNLFQEMIRDGTIERYLKPYEGQILTEDILKKLTHILVQDNYFARAREGRLTGEWIVFSKTPTGNLYLTLASHQEGDKQVWNRIEAYRAIDRLLPPMARYAAADKDTGETDLPSLVAATILADGPSVQLPK
jgi:hypothetical protein